MPNPLLPRGAFARLGIVALIALFFAVPQIARAEWKDMNSDVNATNFIVKVGPPDSPSGLCTGTLISLKYRLVLTANHCVDDNIAIEEKEETSDNGVVDKVKREVFTDMQLEQKNYQGFRNVGSATFLSRIVAHKKAYDLGLLQIRADTIPQTVYSHVLGTDGKVERGDTVFAVGNPRGLDASVSKGIVSSTTRMIKVSWADADVPFYQVDAAINSGNSGGALYNADGQLIGLPDASAGAGLGLAIPVDVLRKFLTENCYEDVWNDGNAAKTHDQCVADKLKEENDRREKNGVAPLQPSDKAESSGGLTLKALNDMEERRQTSIFDLFTMDHAH
jgi:V8-like Glu-specific endopeptidase